MQNQERLAKASRERGLGFSDTVFGTSHLGGVTRDEMVHDLVTVEFGDRREDTAGIASQENNVGWVVIRDTGYLGVGDKVDWVGATGVFGQSGVVVIDDTGDRIENDVFEDRAETNGVKDFGFFLR